jgi:CBS domain-containing protein
MAVADYCQRRVVTAGADLSAREAAQRMEQEGVGTLIITKDERPIGLLSDRDLALGVLCERLDPGAVQIGELMRKPPVTVTEDTPVGRVVQTLRVHALRRLPVVNAGGKLVGIIAIDDLIGLLGHEISGLAEAVRSQQPHVQSGEERRETIDRSE